MKMFAFCMARVIIGIQYIAQYYYEVNRTVYLFTMEMFGEHVTSLIYKNTKPWIDKSCPIKWIEE